MKHIKPENDPLKHIKPEKRERVPLNTRKRGCDGPLRTTQDSLTQETLEPKKSGKGAVIGDKEERIVEAPGVPSTGSPTRETMSCCLGNGPYHRPTNQPIVHFNFRLRLPRP